MIIGLLAVAGCAGPEKFLTPDGREGYLVSCSGTLYSWPSCYADARKLCAGDYRELRRTDYAREAKPIRTLEFVCGS